MSRHLAGIRRRREERTGLKRAYQERNVPREIDISRGRPRGSRGCQAWMRLHLQARFIARACYDGRLQRVFIMNRAGLRNARSAFERKISRRFIFTSFSLPPSAGPLSPSNPFAVVALRCVGYFSILRHCAINPRYRAGIFVRIYREQCPVFVILSFVQGNNCRRLWSSGAFFRKFRGTIMSAIMILCTCYW